MTSVSFKVLSVRGNTLVKSVLLLFKTFSKLLLRSLKWKINQVQMRVSKYWSSERVHLKKDDQLLFLYIAVDRFLKRTLSLDWFLKHALSLDRFFIGRIALISASTFVSLIFIDSTSAKRFPLRFLLIRGNYIKKISHTSHIVWKGGWGQPCRSLPWKWSLWEMCGRSIIMLEKPIIRFPHFGYFSTLRDLLRTSK